MMDFSRHIKAIHESMDGKGTEHDVRLLEVVRILEQQTYLLGGLEDDHGGGHTTEGDRCNTCKAFDVVAGIGRS